MKPGICGFVVLAVAVAVSPSVIDEEIKRLEKRRQTVAESIERQSRFLLKVDGAIEALTNLKKKYEKAMDKEAEGLK